MKGDQMGILAAYPTQRELPLSNQTRFNSEYKEVKSSERTQMPGQAHPRRGPLQQNLTPKPHQPGRAPTGLGRALARFLHQALRFDEPTEVLLVQANASERFHRALELQERKGGRHQ